MALKIVITNLSDTEFNLWFHHSGLTFNETLENSPSDKLQAYSGMTKMAASQNTATWAGRDKFYISCGYTGGGLSFGIQCKENAQVFGVGTHPEYAIADGKGGWTDINESEQHVWTTSKLIATAVPTITHTDISVNVMIKNNM